MHRLTLAALILLASTLMACVSPTVTKRQAFRNPAAPIYSAAVVDLARLNGSWTEVATMQPASGSTCRKPGGMRISGGIVEYRLCIGGRVATGKGPLRVSGPGRFALPGLALEVWVLWVDGDYRTLVLGTPKGAFGVLLDRGAISADRETAAREILDWNGYDLGFYHRF